MRIWTTGAFTSTEDEGIFPPLQVGGGSTISVGSLGAGTGDFSGARAPADCRVRRGSYIPYVKTKLLVDSIAEQPTHAGSSGNNSEGAKLMGL